MKIKVLGAGCSCCSQLYANVEEAVELLGWDEDIEFIHDISKALEYEVLQMPALIVNEKVVSFGSDLSVSEVKRLLEANKN